MTSIIDIEKGASRLRRHFKRAQLPELRLLCGLRFFELLAFHSFRAGESYFREFVPALATAATKSDPREFLPEEIQSLGMMIEQVSTLKNNVVDASDQAALEQLHRATRNLSGTRPSSPVRKGSVVIDCLFVEYYPDLDLPPRGRLLSLKVVASSISAKNDCDDIFIRNPIEEPDDRFLAQARDSIKAARQFLSQRYGLSPLKRYRFDFAVDSTGARFTGDSLGLAFAMGAIAALGSVEIFTEKLSILPGAVFSGALKPSGEVSSIDGDALKLKVYRAFHSSAHTLVVPANHLSEAEKYMQELVERFPGRSLALAGVNSLDAVVHNRELVRSKPLSPSKYVGLKIASVSRSAKVQVPLLVILALLFAFVLADRFLPPCSKPWGDCNPEYVQLTKRGFEALNADSVAIWEIEYECDVITERSQAAVGDIDRDGKNEVAFCPHPTALCEANATLFVYNDGGSLLFRRSGVNSGTCSIDTTMHIPGEVDLIERDSGVVIVSKFFRSYPAHTHIRAWSATGDSLGWFWNRGFTSGALTRCFPESNNEQFLFRGIFNPINCAAMYSLDLDSCSGFGPTDRPVIVPTKGKQKHYILFALSDVEKEEDAEYNGVYQIYNESSKEIRADVGQVYINDMSRSYLLSYWFDTDLRVTRVEADDRFVPKRNKLVAEGKLPPIDWPIYCALMRDSVKYWSDSGWVTEGQLRALDNLHLNNPR